MSQNDVNSVWAMITYYGGSFQLDLNEDCTHLIAAKPEGVLAILFLLLLVKEENP